jgi:ATPase subunit of ABC transporter with duplicated ATPase domains
MKHIQKFFIKLIVAYHASVIIPDLSTYVVASVDFRNYFLNEESMITLRNVSKSFGNQALFNDVSLQINNGDRFALVGPNGAGKSTLFKLIMGLEAPDDGNVTLRTGITFGYLPQETSTFSHHHVLQEVLGDDASSNQRQATAKKILMGLGFKITDFERAITELSGRWKLVRS